MTAVTAAGRPSSSLHFVVGEMNGKLDQLMASLLPQLNALRAADDELDSRVTTLEVWQGRMMGGGAIIIFLVSAFEVIRYVIR